MGWRASKNVLAVAAWFAFPVIPVLLVQASYHLLNMGEADPREWDWPLWLIALGPLWGLGFLAGATWGIADVPGRRGLWAWLTCRSAWVAAGPWVGFLFWAGVYYVLSALEWLFERLCYTPPQPETGSLWTGTRGEVLLWFILMTAAYGWLIVAVAAVRRARRAGQLKRALRRALLSALAFVGSLMASFWAATEAWRSYFFDATAVRSVILFALCLTLLTGCGPATLGEMRRRELFDALLMAWVLGLALVWRWWGRPGPNRPAS